MRWQDVLRRLPGPGWDVVTTVEDGVRWRSGNLKQLLSRKRGGLENYNDELISLDSVDWLILVEIFPL